MIISADSFRVGLDLEIELEIRPRTLSGVLVSVSSSTGEYLILQLVDGDVREQILNKISKDIQCSLVIKLLDIVQILI